MEYTDGEAAVFGFGSFGSTLTLATPPVAVLMGMGVNCPYPMRIRLTNRKNRTPDLDRQTSMRLRPPSWMATYMAHP
jgi:hypothetical protein